MARWFSAQNFSLEGFYEMPKGVGNSTGILRGQPCTPCEKFREAEASPFYRKKLPWRWWPISAKKRDDVASRSETMSQSPTLALHSIPAGVRRNSLATPPKTESAVRTRSVLRVFLLRFHLLGGGLQVVGDMEEPLLARDGDDHHPRWCVRVVKLRLPFP